MNKVKRPLGRVDVQVSILTAVMVLITTLSVFSLCYYITYNDMIEGLTDRVMSIYNYLEENLEKDTFLQINGKDDMNSEAYRTNKEMLEQIKNTTGVLYLYTAKEHDDGSLIYVIDGLDYDAPDFRYPGDAIEPDIQAILQRALAGEVILPDQITDTDWGKIFITYLPIHDGNRIIGVVGIEFEAEHQFDTYSMLIMTIPVICLILCLGTVIIAVIAFRRVSNPFYQDMYNTDGVTGLKNRNAFDVDIQNINAKKKCEGIGIIVMDLNSLKKVNDNMGHDTGDRYIRLIAESLNKRKNQDMVLFRTGGDEFVALIREMKGGKDPVLQFIGQVQQDIAERSTEFGMPLSAAAGFAAYDKAMDQDLWSVYKRADNAMYDNKKKHHMEDMTS